MIYYTVSFYDINGEILGEPQKVLSGNDATPPIIPVPEGKEFVRWNPDYHDVRQNLSCHPIFDTIRQQNPKIVSEINRNTTKYIFD